VIVKELITKLRFKTDNSGKKSYLAGLKSIAKQAQALTRAQTRGVAGVGSAYSRTIANMRKQWSAGMADMMRGGNGFANKQISAASSIGGAYARIRNNLVGLGAGYLGFQALTNAAQDFVQAGMDSERVMMQLTSQRGPLQAVRDMRALEQLAAQTPYNLTELASGFQRLNAAGFKVDINQFRSLGDLAAGSNKSIDDLVSTMIGLNRNQGAMVDNFNGMGATMKDGGQEVSSYDSKTKKTTKTLVKAGEQAKILAAYLKAAGEQDTVGGMARLAGTLEGLLSTLKDSVEQLYRTIFKTGVGSVLKEMTKGAISLLGALEPVTKEFGIWLGLNLRSWSKTIADNMGILAGALKIAAAVASLLIARFIGLKAIAIASFIYQAVVAMRALTIAEIGAAAAGGLVNLALLAIPIAIGLVIAAVAFLAYDMYSFFTTGNSMLLDWTKDWPILNGVIRDCYTLVMALWMGITDLGGVVEWWKGVAINAFNEWKQNVTNTLNYVKEFFMSVWNAIVEIVRSAIARVVEIFNTIKTAISNALGGIGGAFASALAPGISAATTLYNKLVAAANVRPNVSAMGAAAGKIPGKSKGGMIPSGYPNDSYLMRAESGEMVVSAKGVRMIQSGNVMGGLRTVPGFSMPNMATAATQAPRPMIASAGGGSIVNNIRQQFNVSVSNSGATASQIAKTTGSAVLDQTKAALDSARRSYPQRVSKYA
jgi:hypothetical protein